MTEEIEYRAGCDCAGCVEEKTIKPEQESYCKKCHRRIMWDGNVWYHEIVWTLRPPYLGYVPHEIEPKYGGYSGRVEEIVGYLLKVIDESRKLPTDEADKLREKARSIDLKLV